MRNLVAGILALLLTSLGSTLPSRAQNIQSNLYMDQLNNRAHLPDSKLCHDPTAAPEMRLKSCRENTSNGGLKTDDFLAIAKIEAVQGHPSRALQAIASAENRIADGSTSPNESQARFAYRRAYVHALTGQPQKAIAEIDKPIIDAGHDNDKAEALNQRCYIRGLAGQDLDTAMADCTKALSLAKTDHEKFMIMNSRALVEYRKGKLDASLNDLNTILSTGPDLPSSRYLRGTIDADRGNFFAARIDLKVARQNDTLVAASFADIGITPPKDTRKN